MPYGNHDVDDDDDHNNNENNKEVEEAENMHLYLDWCMRIDMVCLDML